MYSKNVVKSFNLLLFLIFSGVNCNNVVDLQNDNETKTYSLKIIFNGDIGGLNNLKIFLDGQQIQKMAADFTIGSIKYGNHSLYIIPNLAYKEIFDTIFIDKDLSITYNLSKKKTLLLEGVITDSNSVISDVSVTTWVWNHVDSLKMTLTNKNGYFSVMSLEGVNYIKLDKINYDEIIDTIINDGITLHSFKMIKDYKWGDYFPIVEGKKNKYKYKYEYYNFNCCHYILDGVLNCEIIKIDDTYYLSTILEVTNTYDRLTYGKIDSSYIESIREEKTSIINEDGENNFTVIIPNFPGVSVKRYYSKDEPAIIIPIDENLVILKQERNIGISFYQFSRTLSVSLTISDKGEISLIE